MIPCSKVWRLSRTSGSDVDAVKFSLVPAPPDNCAFIRTNGFPYSPCSRRPCRASTTRLCTGDTACACNHLQGDNGEQRRVWIWCFCHLIQHELNLDVNLNQNLQVWLSQEVFCETGKLKLGKTYYLSWSSWSILKGKNAVWTGSAVLTIFFHRNWTLRTWHCGLLDEEHGGSIPPSS